MSRHELTQEHKKWVFGWDQPLQSYFLQVHDTNLSEEENPVIWLERDMYEIEDLMRAMREHGPLYIGQVMKTTLHADKDEGR